MILPPEEFFVPSGVDEALEKDHNPRGLRKQDLIRVHIPDQSQKPPQCC